MILFSLRGSPYISLFIINPSVFILSRSTTSPHLIDILVVIKSILFQVLAVEPKNIEASKMKILQMVCRGSQYEDGAVALRRLFVELERAEPKNAGQFIANARLFSRVCGRDQHVLEATAMFAEKAATLESTSAVAMAEVGQQCLLRNKIKDAQRYYKVINRILNLLR